MALVQAPTRNARLLAWVDEMVELCQPDDVHWFDGSDEEHALLCKQLVDAGTFTELDPAKRPGSYWAHSDPERRRPGGGPHLHLLGERGRRRSHQQLEGPRGDAGQARRAVPADP